MDGIAATGSRAFLLTRSEAPRRAGAGQQERWIAEDHELHPLEEDARRIPVGGGAEVRKPLLSPVVLDRPVPGVAEAGPVRSVQPHHESLYEREAARLQLGAHADAASQQKAQWLRAAQFQRFTQEQDTARALLEKLIGMQTMAASARNRLARLSFLPQADRNAFVLNFSGLQAMRQMTELITKGADYSTAVPRSLIDPEEGRAIFRRMQAAYAGVVGKGIEKDRMTDEDRRVWMSAIGDWAWPPTGAHLKQMRYLNQLIQTQFESRKALLPPMQQGAVDDAYQAFERGEFETGPVGGELPTPAAPPSDPSEDF